LDGTIATAHTANDNAETVLMHMVRGTGLKGLGAIAPVSGKLIRPMLRITRQEVLAFLEEYHVPHIHDRSNDSDAFLRNRLRHHVMPLLEQENPRLALNLSDMALRLRQDEALLQEVTQVRDTLEVAPLLELPPALRSRAIANFLTACGMKEPAANHISLVEKLARSNNPSAKADLPGGICVCRDYGILRKYCSVPPLRTLVLPCPGSIDLPEQRLRVTCREANTLQDRSDCFTVQPHGALILRCRSAGDTITLHGGTKSLKALFIDRKIPADQRLQIPVIADDAGLVGVYGFGVDRRRLAENLPAVEICFQSL